jgi:hypothetical protein
VTRRVKARRGSFWRDGWADALRDAAATMRARRVVYDDRDSGRRSIIMTSLSGDVPALFESKMG